MFTAAGSPVSATSDRLRVKAVSKLIELAIFRLKYNRTRYAQIWHTFESCQKSPYEDINIKI